MSGLEIRELEGFLTLSEELHFGRAADRLYVSQSRVSQLLKSLESRVGGRLVERTSRRVRLTPLGERFLADLRPAYGALHAALERARDDARGVSGVLRIGFAGTLNERLMRQVGAFQEANPESAVEVAELPLSDPFGAVRRAEVDAAIVLTPVAEPELAVGPEFSVTPMVLVVGRRHPLAARRSVSAEELAECPLVGIADPAPRYWREAQSPTATPGGRPIPRGPVVATLQEGLTMAAMGRAGMLLCAATAREHRRTDLTPVPVTGLPPSALTLVWLPANRTARLDAFARTLTSCIG